ncbi:MAG: iron-containing alcohol dehydrogenase [Chthoniobacteraceae bacterium]|nr:iron-containing alcohol dehydrogenase [Chthoniobacteraceae bacterium]
MEPRKFVAPEFILGEGALDLSGRYAANLAAKKVFLVTDPGVIEAGWAGKVEDALRQAGLPAVVFSDISSNPQDTEVMAGAERYLREQCDVIVAVGGGSPMDCAKGIGVVASNGENILRFEGVDQIGVPCPPLICIPTTAGSAADISQFAIITDTSRKVKIAIISKAVVPDLALVDPLTTTSMPADLTAATGIDALVHAMEAYVSNANSPVTDLHALEAIRLVACNLKGAIEQPDALRFRDSMMLASLLAGLAFSNASLGLVHAMAHSLGGCSNLPHGMCNAYLLEHVVNFNFDAAAERYARIGEAFGLEMAGLPQAEQKARLVNALRQFRIETGVTGGLSEVGMRKCDLPKLAENALKDPCVITNPIEPTVQDITAIYERAF